MLAYFDSGNNIPVDKAVIKGNCAEVAALRAALAETAPVQEQQPAPASKPVLLQCLGCERVGTQEQLSASTDCDCWLHTQPAPVQEQQFTADELDLMRQWFESM